MAPPRSFTKKAARLVLLGWVAIFLACSPESPPRQPHLLLIVCDTLRADHLDLYDYDRTTAPALTAWASEALVFDHTTAPSNWTRPSMLSLFTGRHPQPDRNLHPKEPFPEDVPVLSEALRRQGYETVGITANLFMTPALGAARGFDIFLPIGFSPEGLDGHWKERISSKEVLDKVAYLLRQRGNDERPLFLYVHFMDTHLPYDPPLEHRIFSEPDYAGPMDGSGAPYRMLNGNHVEDVISNEDRNQVIALYDGEIRQFDESLAQLRQLTEQFLADRDVVTLVTSDHGEAFGEGPQGRYKHGHGTAPYVSRVPLILHGISPDNRSSFPSLSSGRVNLRVGLVDIFPTFLELAGATPPKFVDGRSLLSPQAKRDFIFYRGGPSPHRVASGELAIIRDDFRAVRQSDGWALFDQTSGENISDYRADVLAELQSIAHRWSTTSPPVEEGGELDSAQSDTSPLSEDLDEKLRALGYVEG